MIDKKKMIWIGAGLLVAILAFYWIWRQQPAQVVRRQADELLKIGSLPERTGPADLLFRADALRGLIDQDVLVAVEAFGRSEQARGKDEALTAFQMYTQVMGGTKLVGDYGDIEVIGALAKVPLRLRAQVKAKDGSWSQSVLQGRFEFRETDDGWRLTLAEFAGE